MNIKDIEIIDIVIKDFYYKENYSQDEIEESSTGFLTNANFDITLNDKNNSVRVTLGVDINPTTEKKEIITNVSGGIKIEVYFDISKVDKTLHDKYEFIELLTTYSFSTLRGISFAKFQGTMLQDSILPLFKSFNTKEEDFEILEEE